LALSSWRCPPPMPTSYAYSCTASPTIGGDR
jgi:hypothetical protein